jgi:hypothetical protein
VELPKAFVLIRQCFGFGIVEYANKKVVHFKRVAAFQHCKVSHYYCDFAWQSLSSAPATNVRLFVAVRKQLKDLKKKDRLAAVSQNFSPKCARHSRRLIAPFAFSTTRTDRFHLGRSRTAGEPRAAEPVTRSRYQIPECC